MAALGQITWSPAAPLPLDAEIETVACSGGCCGEQGLLHHPRHGAHQGRHSTITHAKQTLLATKVIQTGCLGGGTTQSGRYFSVRRDEQQAGRGRALPS